jgi:hypothetical protein
MFAYAIADIEIDEVEKAREMAKYPDQREVSTSCHLYSKAFE